MCHTWGVWAPTPHPISPQGFELLHPHPQLLILYNNLKLWTDNPLTLLKHARRRCLRQGTCMHICFGRLRYGWKVRRAIIGNRPEPKL